MAGKGDIKIGCLSSKEIIRNGGSVVENTDGSVSVFYNNPRLGLYPVPATLTCCKRLNPNYYFDINTQTCKWSNVPVSCGFSEPINLVINPKGDDGTLFFVDDFEKETCDLKISFDYLLKIKCEDLLNLSNPTVTTNIQSQETITQIVDTQLTISEINSQIESITNQIVNLNEEYLITPYSIECNAFPIITTTPDCVRPAGTIFTMLTTQVNNVTFTGSLAAACTALNSILLGTAGQGSSSSSQITSLTVGGVVYYDNATTDCTLVADGYYIVQAAGIPPKLIHVVNGIIISFDTCATGVCYSYSFYALAGNPFYWIDCAGVRQSMAVNYGTTYVIPCAKEGSVTGNGVVTQLNSCTIPSSIDTLTAFDKSGFNTVEIDTNPEIYQKGTITTYTTVNFCLTDLGLEAWSAILGPIRYQQFILGDPNSYTCDDVIELADSLNAAELFYDCEIAFGTKSTILVQINTLITQLSALNIQLTEQENILIDLQNNLETTIVSNNGCRNTTEALESLDVEMHLDVVNDDNSLTSVFSAATFPAINLTSNLYEYLTTHGNSGLYICGDPSNTDIGLSACTTLSLNSDNGLINNNVYSCDSIVDELIKSLYFESGIQDYQEFLNTLPVNSLASNWLTYSTVITDPAIISLITNKKIKISLKIKFSCVDFCVLLDNIVLDKSCKSVDRNDIIISQNPGFELKRVIDNKKSWIDVTTPTNREFLIAKSNGTNPIRQTDYNVNDERLVINSKEIDLDICVASAIETDVWCYLSDNPCLLTGCTESILTHKDPFGDEKEDFPITETSNPNNCEDYNGVFSAYLDISAITIDIAKCSKIMQFYDPSPFGRIYDNYYYLTEDWNGNLGFYVRNYNDFVNFSQIYRTQECCESLISVLEVYNNSVPDNEKLVPYWDTHCEKCKVESHKCGDDNLDFHYLVTQPISGVTTIEQFENLMTTELIDVKNRQTISSYPTLRAVYDRYLHSSDYCGTVSSAFDYQNMDRFAGLVGNYWIDLIEQVVPSTTIWGSVKIYTNTIFDEQKFKYKSYSSLLCNNPFQGQQVLSPINGVYGECQRVSVVYQSLTSNKEIPSELIATNLIGEQVMLLPTESSLPPQITSFQLAEIGSKPKINVCDDLCIAQMNYGSEFISYIPFETPIIKEPCVDCENETIPVGNEPGDGVFNSDFSRFYVANKTDLTVSVIDTTSNLVIATISVPVTDIRYITYTSDYNKLYVTSEQDDTLTVIDCSTNTIIGSTIPTGSEPRTTTYVSYNKYLYSYDQNGITVVDTYNDTVVTNINLLQPNGAYNGTYNPDKKYIYTFNIQDDTISVINVVTNTIVTTVSTDVGPSWGYYHSSNKLLYFINVYDETAQFMNTNTNTIVGSVPVESDPSSIIYNPDNKCLYVANEYSSTVTIIDTTTNSVVINLPVDPKGINTIYVPLNKKMYIDNEQATTINALTTTNYTPLLIQKTEAIAVGSNPNGLAYNPVNESIYVTNSGSANVTVLKCLTQKKIGDLNIKECDLAVTIDNQSNKDGEIILVAQTAGGTLPFTYLWSNGETTSEIYVPKLDNYSVRVTDANCCSKTARYNLIVKEYKQFQNGQYFDFMDGDIYEFMN